MEPLDDWTHVEKGLVNSKKRAWSLAKPSEGTDAWVARLWSRMDRDRNGYLTRKELDCEEFHNIIRAAVAPQSGLSTGGAAYSRTQVNVDGAIEMCLRKADVNKDAKLSFKEFRSLMRCLREPRMARYSANLAFALFDLDGNHFVSRNEFRELYAFLLGHLPTLEDFEKEWDRLVQPNPLTSPGAAGEFADQRSYIRWLQSSENPVIRQQAPECQAHSAAPKATIPTSPTSSGSLGIGGIELIQTRPRWNQRFNCGVNPGHVNDSRPAGLREYFSRQQSMPELKRFWEAHYGSTFKRHLEAHYNPPASAPPCKLFPKSLSTEGGSPMTLPQRHSPGGSMRDLLSGEIVAWHDYWSPPARYRRPFHLQDRPLLPFETFGDVVDSSKIDSSPSTLRRHNKMLDARLRRRQKLGGPQRKCLLEAEPW